MVNKIMKKKMNKYTEKSHRGHMFDFALKVFHLKKMDASNEDCRMSTSNSETLHLTVRNSINCEVYPYFLLNKWVMLLVIKCFLSILFTIQ